MTYIKQQKETFQKDLYIKKQLEVENSVTPWVPKIGLTIKSIVCELSDTPIGTGSSTIRIWNNRGDSSQQIVFDAVFNANDSSKTTASNFLHTIDSGDNITYSVTQVTSDDPGGQAIISFMYENT